MNQNKSGDNKIIRQQGSANFKKKIPFKENIYNNSNEDR
ncbi:hypothetical protein PMALA_057560, partial [Plasmodium malariae]